MRITKAGHYKKDECEFKFACSECGCEWEADRSEVKFTPPSLPYNVYMKCPNCKSMTYKKN